MNSRHTLLLRHCYSLSLFLSQLMNERGVRTTLCCHSSFAYCTDCNRIPEDSMKVLTSLEILVIDALRPTPHPTHFSLPETLALLAVLRPRSSYLIHMGHDLEHQETEKALPESVRLAYDGLVLEF